MTKSFYVYMHFQADTGACFYVGKGTRHSRGEGYRRAADFCRRKKSWKAVFAKHGFLHQVVAEFFEEQHALQFEAELIASIGRRDLGLGPLINHTDGGVGCSGFKHKPETIERIRAANVGRPHCPIRGARISAANSGEKHWGWGKKHSPETCERKRASMLGKQKGEKSPCAKRVVDTATGRTFACAREAAEYLGIPASTMAKKLTGNRTNNTTMRFA